MYILDEIRTKDLVTLTGTVSGLSAIFLMAVTDLYWIGLTLVFFAFVTDILDGYIARKLGQENKLGKELDSLNDSICFGIAPAVIIYRAYTRNIMLPGYTPVWPLWVMAFASCIYIIFIIIRLSWFDVEQSEGYAGLISPLAALLLLSIMAVDMIWFRLSTISGWPFYFPVIPYSIPFIIVAVSYLTVCPYIIYGDNVRRKSGRLRYGLLVFGLIGAGAVILGYFDPGTYGIYVFLAFILIIVTVIVWTVIGIGNYRKLPDEDKKKIRSVLREIMLKDIITLIGGGFGIFAIIYSIDRFFPWLAATLIMSATVTDMLDGYVARKLGQVNELGKELDSLSDNLVFGTAPAVFMFSFYTGNVIFSGHGGITPFWIGIAAALYAVSIVCRLAYFNISEEQGYIGLVAPLSSSLVMSTFIVDFTVFCYLGYGNSVSELLGKAVPFIMLVAAYLNMSKYLIYGKNVKLKQGIVKYAMLITGSMVAAAIVIGFFNESAIISPFIPRVTEWTLPPELVPVLSLIILVIMAVYYAVMIVYIGYGVKNYIRFGSIKRMSEYIPENR